MAQLATLHTFVHILSTYIFWIPYSLFAGLSLINGKLFYFNSRFGDIHAFIYTYFNGCCIFVTNSVFFAIFFYVRLCFFIFSQLCANVMKNRERNACIYLHSTSFQHILHILIIHKKKIKIEDSLSCENTHRFSCVPH